jgi:phosphoribosylformylglycinamidine synthase
MVPAKVRLFTIRTAQIHLSTLIRLNHIDFALKIITIIAMKKIPLKDVLTAVALSPNVVSRRPILEKYDKNVQGNSYLERGQAASAVILPFSDFPELPQDKKAIGVTVGTGGNPNRAKISAQLTAEMAICEAALQTSCVGGTWLGATDCLNFGNPEKEDQMGDFVAGVEGVKVACQTLDIPIVSGNVSLYNENNGQAVPPSALVSVFSRVDNIAWVKPITWKSSKAFIYQVGPQSAALGGSEFDRLFELGSTELPALDYEKVKQADKTLKSLLSNEAIEAVIPLSVGGVWGTLVGGALNSGTGFELRFEAANVLGDLFSETLGALVISTAKIDDLTLLGETKADLVAQISIDDEKHTLELKNIEAEWNHQLRRVF